MQGHRFRRYARSVDGDAATKSWAGLMRLRDGETTSEAARRFLKRREGFGGGGPGTIAQSHQRCPTVSCDVAVDASGTAAARRFAPPQHDGEHDDRHGCRDSTSGATTARARLGGTTVRLQGGL